MRLTTFATAVFFGENSEFFVFFASTTWTWRISRYMNPDPLYRRRSKSDEEAKELLRQIVQDGKHAGRWPQIQAFRKSSFCFFSTLYLWLVVGFESCSAPQQTQHSKSRSGSQPRWSFFVLPKHILAPKRQAHTLEISLVTTLVDHPHLELMIILETGDRWWAKGSSLGLTSKDPFCDTSSTKNQIQTSMFGQKSMSTKSKSSLHPSRQVKYLKPLSLTREGKPVAWTQCRAVYTTARKRWCLSVSLTTV